MCPIRNYTVFVLALAEIFVTGVMVGGMWALGSVSGPVPLLLTSVFAMDAVRTLTLWTVPEACRTELFASVLTLGSLAVAFFRMAFM